MSTVEVFVSSGLPLGQGLWVQETWVWHKPSWRRLPLTPPQSNQNLHRTGETDSLRAQIKPCAYQDPGEKSCDPTRHWPRLAHECPGVWQRHGSAVAWCRVGSTERDSAWDLLREVAIISITSTIPWPQVEQQGENTAPPIDRKLDSRFTEHGPAYQNKTQFPHREASISLLSFSARGQTDWKPQSQKTNHTDHMDHSLV